MVVRMRSTKSHTANRRSHHALEAVTHSKCDHCGAPQKRHSVCSACGYYRGRLVLDVVKTAEKKAKKAKAKNAEATK